MKVSVITHTALLLCILGATGLAYAKKLLVITPTPSYSHHTVFRSLCLELHKRGYEMIVLTPNPIKDPTLKNYTEIDMSHLYSLIDDHGVRQMVKEFRYDLKIKIDMFFHKLIEIILAQIFNELKQLNIYDNDPKNKIDAVIIEPLYGPAFHMPAYKLGVPLIGILSVDLHLQHHYDLGNALLPSHRSNWENCAYTGTNLSFWTRVRNYLYNWIVVYAYRTFLVPPQNQLIREHFEGTTVDMDELRRYMSILFVNHHPAMGYARPTLPSTIFYNGLHIAKTPPPLPRAMKEFLDDATNGFIYVSLGTNSIVADLSDSAPMSFLNVFSRLPYKILWKNDEHLPRNLSNLFVSKWIPQQGVLAHPNIKLFVTQGGLQSTEEAVHYGVPLVGVPVMFDQLYRVRKMAELEVGREVSLQDFSEDQLHDAIIEVLNNQSYKRNMEKLRAIVRESTSTSMERVIYWIEHTIRHNGTQYLHFDGEEAPWYERDDVDVVAFLSIVLFVVIMLLLSFVVSCLMRGSRYLFTATATPLNDPPSTKDKNKKTE